MVAEEGLDGRKVDYPSRPVAQRAKASQPSVPDTMSRSGCETMTAKPLQRVTGCSRPRERKSQNFKRTPQTLESGDANSSSITWRSHYPYRNLHTHVRRVYDAFGPQRMMWGSDLSRLRGTCRECVTMFTEEMGWLSGQDLEWIMGRTLGEWLGWL